MTTVIKDIMVALRTVRIFLNPYISPIGIALNICLCYMILRKSTTHMKPFKKALYLGCLTDIGFGLFLLLFSPTVFVNHGTYIIILQGVLGYFNRDHSIYPFIFYLFFMYTAITNAAVQFLFRYMMVCRNVYLSKVQFLFTTLTFMTFSVTYSIITFIIYYNQPAEQVYFDKLNGTEWPSDGSFTQFSAAPTSAFHIIVFVIAIPLTTISYAIVTLSAYLVWHKLNALKAGMSNDVRQMHSEVSIIFIVEATVPYVTIVIPISIDLLKMLNFNVEIGFIAEFCCILTVLAPPLNALVKLCTIKSYRKTIVLAAYKFVGRKLSQNTSVVYSSPTTFSNHRNSTVLM